MDEESKPLAVFVLPTPTLGGAERITQIVAEHVAKLGYRVTVYCISKGNQDGWRSVSGNINVEVIVGRYGRGRMGVWGAVRFLFRVSRAERVEYVWSSHVHVNAFLSLLRRFGILRCDRLIARESTRIFDRFHGGKRMVFWAMYRFCYGAQDLLICQTAGMRSSLVAALRGKPVANMAVISNPYIARAPETTRRQRATRQRELLVVACGRLERVKGFDILIEAFSIVSQEMPSARLVILGEGAERASLEGQVTETGLGDIVSIIGYESDVESWFGVADVGVISSRSEGFPNVILEMMASGTKNIVSTPCSDGVDELPAVSICRDFSPQDIALNIVRGLRSDSRSAIYQEYVRDERSVGGYWKKILHELNSR